MFNGQSGAKLGLMSERVLRMQRQREAGWRQGVPELRHQLPGAAALPVDALAWASLPGDRPWGGVERRRLKSAQAIEVQVQGGTPRHP